MKNTKIVASGAMLTALCVVIMLLGAVLELGMYAAPLLAGVMLVPYGGKYGYRAQLTAFAAIGLLSLMLVQNIEQNLMFLAFFGWYPMLQPKLCMTHRGLGLLLKLLVFNVPVIAVETLIIKILVPETMTKGLIAVLLVLGNAAFLIYDIMLPRLSFLLLKYQKFM